MLSHFSCVQLFVTLWTVAHQAPLSMGFFRQKYWSALPCPPPGDLLDPGIEAASLVSPSDGDSLHNCLHWQVGFLLTKPPGKPVFNTSQHKSSLTSLHKYFPFSTCRGPAPAGSRGTLRMNGVGEWERVRQSSRLSLKFIFAWPLYTLNNIFWGEVHIAYTQVISKHYSNLTFNRNRMSPTYFFVHKSLSYHLAFRPANILWLAPGVT